MSLRMAWEGKAGQVRVGHLIQGNRRTLDDVWEVMAMKNPPQIEYGRTPWWKVRNTETNVEAPIPPKIVTHKVRFMLTPEEHAAAERTRRPPHLPVTPVTDSDEVMLVVEKLGATEIASRDNVTGEITCPNYDGTFEAARPGGYLYGVELLEHLRVCHGIDTSHLETLTGDERTLTVARTHGELHRRPAAWAPTGGFPHRHIPEDHSQF